MSLFWGILYFSDCWCIWLPIFCVFIANSIQMWYLIHFIPDDRLYVYIESNHPVSVLNNVIVDLLFDLFYYHWFLAFFCLVVLWHISCLFYQLVHVDSCQPRSLEIPATYKKKLIIKVDEIYDMFVCFVWVSERLLLLVINSLQAWILTECQSCSSPPWWSMKLGPAFLYDDVLNV